MQTDRRRLIIELLVLSFVSLFLELLIIRWVSGDIRFFTVFRTFPLIACFAGLGLGFVLCRPSLWRKFPFALLIFAGAIKLADLTGVMRWAFPSSAVWFWQDFADPSWQHVCLCVPVILALLAAVFFPMLCVGSRLGELMRSFKPLTGYSLNVGGAVAGSAIFAASSFLAWHPWMQLAAVVCATLATQKRRPLSALLAMPAAVFVAWLPVTDQVQTFWTPYQQISVVPLSDHFANCWTDEPKTALSQTEGGAYVLHTNHWFYQYALDLSDAAPRAQSKNLQKLFEENKRQYDLPFKLIKGRQVLVVGAGTGNDVAAALRHGAVHVDAVEIDPVIIELGRQLHPERPYDNPRVSVICDDARHYFQNCKTKYDLVLFAGLDSHTVTGPGSSVRVDTYVYTRESIKQAVALLKQDGIITIVFNSSFNWITDKMFATIRDAVGYDPIVLSDSTSTDVRLPWQTFVIGKAVADGCALSKAQIAPHTERSLWTDPQAKIVTDDWPYLYVSPGTMDIPYALTSGLVLMLCLLSMRPLLNRGAPRYWQLFFLGSAFLLLELRSISQLTLVFGSTWWTTSMVVIGVLVMALAANLIAARCAAQLLSRQGYLYSALVFSLVLAHFLNGQTLMQLTINGDLTGKCLATLASVFPLFIGSLIFSVAFSAVSRPALALGFNLAGAVIGGLLEYTSNFAGINSLLTVAAIFYGISYVAGRRSVDFPGAVESTIELPAAANSPNSVAETPLEGALHAR